MSEDRVEKQVVLSASLERVWRAISDAGEFGTWFGVVFDGPFVAGREAAGRIEPTQVDPEVGRLQESHRGLPLRIQVEQVEPMRLFSFRWHPFAVNPDRNYDAEPMTLVTFTLEEVAGGTRLTIVEDGFDRLPPDRRDAAREANDGGWAHQAKLIEKYLAQRP